MHAVAYDRQLRALLKARLKAQASPGDLVVDEFLLAYGEVRADVALVNGHLEGFEIKAGNDTLARLPRQVEAYDRVFEFSSVVTTKAHLDDVRRLVPAAWGLMVAGNDGTVATLKTVRTAKPNKKRDAEHLARLLWREELLAKLEELGLSRGLKTRPKIRLYAALAAALPVCDLSDYVRTCLKSRADWRADAAPRVYGDLSHPSANE